MKIHKPTKNIIEYCGEENGLASIVLFVHDWGVRFGYVGIRGQYANDVCDCFNHQFPCDDYIPNELEIAELINGKNAPMFVDHHADDILDKMYFVMTSTSIIDRFGRADGFQWVGYDCGHTGETYDRGAIQRYYPDEADKLIKRFSWRDRGENEPPLAVRSLEWCKEQNVKLAKVMSNTQKAYIADFQTDFLSKALQPKTEETVLNKFVVKNGTTLVKYTGNENDVIIPDGIKIIDTDSFRDCTTIKSVTFPDSLKRIEDAAFVGCSNLERLNNVNGGILLGDFAFYGCEKLGIYRKDEDLDLTDEQSRGRS